MFASYVDLKTINFPCSFSHAYSGLDSYVNGIIRRLPRLNLGWKGAGCAEDDEQGCEDGESHFGGVNGEGVQLPLWMKIVYSSLSEVAVAGAWK